MKQFLRASVSLTLLAASIPAAESESETTSRVVDKGIAVELTMTPAGAAAGKVIEHGPAEVSFRIRDTATGAPVRGSRPKAWIERKGAEETSCHDKIQSFLNSSLSARPAVDLNVYHVVVMNEDATLSIIDPLLGYGGSKLLTSVRLESPGADWALSADGRRLYVTMPLAGKLAIVDTATWRVTAAVETGPGTARVRLQSDGRYLWVSSARPGGRGGVIVIDTAAGKQVAQVETGLGPHDIAFTADDQFALVSSKGSGTVSVIDTARQTIVNSVFTGRGSEHLVYSPLARAAFVASEPEGRITVLGGDRFAVTGVIRTRPGVRAMAVTSDGRWGFAANPKTDTVVVFDTAAGRIVHEVEVKGGPDQLVLSDENLYVRSARSELIHLVSLRAIGTGGEVPVIDIPGGQAKPVSGAFTPALAPSLVPGPEGGSMLIANALDKNIYYYAEGMAAPMGSMKTYGRFPRAITIVDRSIREQSPGVYAVPFRAPAAGAYQVAMLLSSPKIVHCFEASVEADPDAKPKARTRLSINVEGAEQGLLRASPGSFDLRMRVRERETGELRKDIPDLEVMLMSASGTFHRRFAAVADADGTYHAAVNIPAAGIYSVWFRVPSLGLRFSDLGQTKLHAAPAQDETGPAEPLSAGKAGALR